MNPKDVLIIVLFGFVILLYLLFKFKKRRVDGLPIDDVRRSFSNDEKFAVAEKTVVKFGKVRCWHCDAVEKLEVDHICPLASGGHNGLENLQLLCKQHNTSKRDRFVG